MASTNTAKPEENAEVRLALLSISSRGWASLRSAEDALEVARELEAAGRKWAVRKVGDAIYDVEIVNGTRHMRPGQRR